MEKKQSDTFRDAAVIMKEHGMCRGTFHDGKSYCIRGAVLTAKFPSEDLPWHTHYGPEGDEYEMETVKDAIPGLEKYPWGGLQHPATWNNMKAKDTDEVVQVLDAAYLLALQEEGLDPAEVLG